MDDRFQLKDRSLYLMVVKFAISVFNFPAKEGVSEIAYILGFEHPQSLSKLFTTKTKFPRRNFLLHLIKQKFDNRCFSYNKH